MSSPTPSPESGTSTTLSLWNYDIMTVVHRLIKYLVEGFMVAVAAYYLPSRKVSIEEVLSIGLVATSTFAIMDIFLPTYAVNTKMGVGFGIGANLVGFPSGGLF